MQISQQQFDPLGVALDWLDTCRLGELNALLDLYDERAILECECEYVNLTGRQSLAAYWAPKLESNLISAFTLDDITLTGEGVQIDYKDHEGQPIRAHSRFSPSGKILHTSCGPLAGCTMLP
jgi:hypothetical protein